MTAIGAVERVFAGITIRLKCRGRTGAKWVGEPMRGEG